MIYYETPEGDSSTLDFEESYFIGLDGGLYVGSTEDSDLGGFYHATSNKHILMQCTGLKNKNSKLIYEGDIVIFTVSLARAGYHKTTNTFETLRGYVGINKYNQHCVICNNGEYHIEKAMEFEIIGNIYENPELLEGICATNSTT